MVSQQFTCCICLPKDQSVNKLSAKARAPTEGPERQQVINKGQSAYRRTRASTSYQQRPERRPKDQSVNKLSAKARAPTEGPERQQVINKKPECLPKDQRVKKLSAKARDAKLERTTNKRHDGNHTRIGRSYTMVVPMNISSHREVGDQAERRRRANETLIRTRSRCKRQTTRQHPTRRLRHLMHDKH